MDKNLQWVLAHRRYHGSNTLVWLLMLFLILHTTVDPRQTDRQVYHNTDFGRRWAMLCRRSCTCSQSNLQKRHRRGRGKCNRCGCRGIVMGDCTNGLEVSVHILCTRNYQTVQDNLGSRRVWWCHGKSLLLGKGRRVQHIGSRCSAQCRGR